MRHFAHGGSVVCRTAPTGPPLEMTRKKTKGSLPP